MPDCGFHQNWSFHPGLDGKRSECWWNFISLFLKGHLPDVPPTRFDITGPDGGRLRFAETFPRCDDGLKTAGVWHAWNENNAECNEWSAPKQLIDVQSQNATMEIWLENSLWWKVWRSFAPNKLWFHLIHWFCDNKVFLLLLNEALKKKRHLFRKVSVKEMKRKPHTRNDGIFSFYILLIWHFFFAYYRTMYGIYR